MAPKAPQSSAAPASEITPKGPAPSRASGELAFASDILHEEGQALVGLAHALGQSGDGAFARAVDLLERCAETGGTVLVTGLGKSGLIGAKISATLASLGIPSHAVHPAEAAHGDLGRFRPVDTVIALSFSGETDEVVNLAALLHQDKLPIIAIVGGAHASSAASDEGASSLERLASVTLRIGVTKEAGGGGYSAPTTSTTAMLALGDALALSVARRRNFTDEDFAKRHPGGSLGGLLRCVTDVLRFRVAPGGAGNVPLISERVSVRGALAQAATIDRRPGALLIVDETSGRLAGIFTDGDLRRLILRSPDELDRPIGDVMTRAPRTLPADALVRDAVRLIRERRQDEIPVVDSSGRPVGILDVQDLIAMRLVRE